MQQPAKLVDLDEFLLDVGDGWSRTPEVELRGWTDDDGTHADRVADPVEDRTRRVRLGTGGRRPGSRTRPRASAHRQGPVMNLWDFMPEDMRREFQRAENERAGTAKQTLWTAPDGWVIGYTTERVTGGPPAIRGKFVCLAYKPVGPGYAERSREGERVGPRLPARVHEAEARPSPSRGALLPALAPRICATLTHHEDPVATTGPGPRRVRL